MSDYQDVILLVEDNPDDVHLISRAFRKANIETPLEVAEDGDQAVNYLSGIDDADGSEVTPVLILLDLKLPRRSGFEVLAWIKRHARLRRVPVVVLTSSKTSTDIERAYDLGANSYLAKPLRPEGLLSMVTQINSYWLSLNERAVVRRAGT